METTGTITGAQLRAARALLKWSQPHLAELAGVSEKTIARAEAASASLDSRATQAIVNVLEAHGVVFISDPTSLGVTLKREEMG